MSKNSYHLLRKYAVILVISFAWYYFVSFVFIVLGKEPHGPVRDIIGFIGAGFVGWHLSNQKWLDRL